MPRHKNFLRFRARQIPIFCPSQPMSPGRYVIFALLGCTCAGCTTEFSSPPVGPGMASTDLTPWLNDAPVVTYTGRVEYFYVESRTGTYLTWAMHPAGPQESCEIDVRACAVDAARVKDHIATVHGRLIPRGPEHLPLLVAQSMQPHHPPALARDTRTRGKIETAALSK
jgi:hypothetical protein